jgi:hypothetical protein
VIALSMLAEADYELDGDAREALRVGVNEIHCSRAILSAVSPKN